jgi:hypothetical protein
MTKAWMGDVASITVFRSGNFSRSGGSSSNVRQWLGPEYPTSGKNPCRLCSAAFSLLAPGARRSRRTDRGRRMSERARKPQIELNRTASERRRSSAPNLFDHSLVNPGERHRIINIVVLARWRPLIRGRCHDGDRSEGRALVGCELVRAVDRSLCTFPKFSFVSIWISRRTGRGRLKMRGHSCCHDHEILQHFLRELPASSLRVGDGSRGDQRLFDCRFAWAARSSGTRSCSAFCHAKMIE